MLAEIEPGGIVEAGQRTAAAGIVDLACRRIDNASLTFFRIGFGAFFAWWAWDYLAAGRVLTTYVEPEFHFTYPFFEWVGPLPRDGMIMTFVIIAILGLLVAFGVWYRVSALLLAITFSYVFLIERTNYQNHYYLMGLLAWWMPWLPLANSVSWDARKCTNLSRWYGSNWMLWLLRFHIGLPYFFGGVAKLHGDWMAGEPMRQILASRSNMPLIGSWLLSDDVVMLFVWGGLLFDLCVVPMLLWRSTRTIAFLLCIGFHLTNAALFNIHVFPWFMIFATTLFFDPDWPRRILGGSPIARTKNCFSFSETSMANRCAALFLVLYCCFHLLWPLRHYLSPGDASWTENGHMFAWRMMLRGKTAGVRYFVVDERTGDVYNPQLRDLINVEQANRFSRDPEMIVQLARYLGQEHRRLTGRTPRVHALVLTSLNGRKPQLYIDPDSDLASVSYRITVLPLTEPLRKSPWTVPLENWVQHVDLPALPVVNSKPPTG